VLPFLQFPFSLFIAQLGKVILSSHGLLGPQMYPVGSVSLAPQLIFCHQNLRPLLSTRTQSGDEEELEELLCEHLHNEEEEEEDDDDDDEEEEEEEDSEFDMCDISEP